MSIIWILVPIAILLGAGFVVLFVWNAKNGQYDDLETPALRILSEPESERKKT